MTQSHPSSHNTTTSTAVASSTEERAAALLGSGLPPETVAASLGISPSRISQLLSTETFAAQVADLRYQNLAKHNARDSSYDTLEDDLLVRLRDCLPLMHRPMEILKAIQVINAAKRRGQSTPESIIEKQSIISLTIPVQIVNKFQTNLQNQVVKAGDQSLFTMQSGTLAAKLKDKVQELNHESQRVITSNEGSQTKPE
jgi:hypothetical protein